MNAALPPMLTLKPCCCCGATGKIEAVNPEWLRFTRLQTAVTLRAMARRMKVSAAYVSDVERGHRNCPSSWLPHYQKLFKEVR